MGYPQQRLRITLAVPECSKGGSIERSIYIQLSGKQSIGLAIRGVRPKGATTTVNREQDQGTGIGGINKAMGSVKISGTEQGAKTRGATSTRINNPCFIRES